MSNPFNDNLERYKNTRRPLVGGSPNNWGQVWKPGTRLPLVQEHYGLDYARLQSDTPDTPYHGVGAMTVKGVSAVNHSGDNYEYQLVVELDDPITSPAFLAVPLINQDGDFDLTNWGNDVEPNFWSLSVSLDMRCALLRVPLDVGDWNLDNLTWNNAHYPNGTLFNDADRFTLVTPKLTGGGVAIGDDGIFGPYNSPGSIVDLLRQTAAVFLTDNYDDVTDKTYYGFLLYFSWGITMTGQGMWGYSMASEATVENLGTTEAKKGRPFLLRRDSGVVNEA